MALTLAPCLHTDLAAKASTLDSPKTARVTLKDRAYRTTYNLMRRENTELGFLSSNQISP